jgi:transposase
MSNRTTPHVQRVRIVERRLSGQTIQQIAAEMQLNYYTVRKWWRAYRDHGWGGLKPKPAGRPASGPLSEFDPLVKYVALRLKRQHPGWGLDLILYELDQHPSLKTKRLPKRTALYCYFSRFYPRLREHRRLRIRRPRPVEGKVGEVHERWQMDFKGEEPLGKVGKVIPFIVCDELTSAPLIGIIHPKTGQGVAPLTGRDVQADLRLVFERWGLPDQIKMDRDPLLVGSSRLEWPGTLLLWLVGLGITPIINPPRRPTKNAQVERCNRTWYEQVALGASCDTIRQAQALTDRAWHLRLTVLPSRNPACAGQPPLQAHPELARPRRPYSRSLETSLFDIQRVYEYLTQWEWERKVDTTGFISMASHNRRISPDHIGQVVKVHFDPVAAQLVAAAVDGTELKRFTLPVVSREHILGMPEGVSI